jgi:hypothetical protein
MIILQCPTKQPKCDNGPPGSNYCTYSPDTSCYLSGWPACCSQSSGVNCPKTKPICDNNNNRSGSSYCTYSADNSCYRNGWPKCCDAASGLTVRMFIFALSLYLPDPKPLNLYFAMNSAPLSSPCVTSSILIIIADPLPITTATLRRTGCLHAVPCKVVSIVPRPSHHAVSLQMKLLRATISEANGFMICFIIGDGSSLLIVLRFAIVLVIE